MKIFYDHQVFSLQDAGGVSRYIYELARYMGQQEDVEPEMAVGMNRSVLPLASLRSEDVVVDRWGGGLPKSKYRYLVNEIYCSAVALARGKMDIYHPTLSRRMPLVRARRVVVTQHDCIHELFPHHFRDAEMVIRATRKLLAQADAIICISESARQDTLSFYRVDPEKMRVIHHGLNPLPRSAEAAAKVKAMVRREYILFVGSRPEFKNFDRLLEAYRDTGLHHSFDLLVLGGGALTEAEVRLAARLELSDCVLSVPYCEDAFLAEAYAGARLFAYPAYYGGFGFPPLEAMSVGCPVLVCRSSSFPEVCLDAAFYFSNEDSSSLASCLLQAACDEAARAHAVARGREVAARYNWAKCGQETLELYRNCL
jgi:glycosyltransferase involved in cell wall biosynthesis